MTKFVFANPGDDSCFSRREGSGPHDVAAASPDEGDCVQQSYTTLCHLLRLHPD